MSSYRKGTTTLGIDCDLLNFGYRPWCFINVLRNDNHIDWKKGFLSKIEIQVIDSLPECSTSVLTHYPDVLHPGSVIWGMVNLQMRFGIVVLSA